MSWRKLFAHPVAAMLATVALLLVLKAGFGVPRTGLRALLFIALLGYGCGLVYVAMLYASPWVPALKKLTFPEAWKNDVFRYGMALSAFSLRAVVAAGAALLLFDADPAGVTRVFAAILPLATAIATMPLTRAPQTAP